MRFVKEKRLTMEKLAIIDMGSNSIRFIVVQICENGSYSLLYQQKESIRLGKGLYTKKMLSEEGMERALVCLKMYAHMIKVMGVQTCLAVATAAVRNARNGKEFIERIQSETHIDIEIISGTREAYLGYLGVINTIDSADFIQFDLGGASVEISLIRNRDVVHSISVPIGAVNLTERFKLQNNVSTALLKECTDFIDKNLFQIPWLENVNLPVIGIGGTVRNIAKIDQRITNYQLPRLHNYRLPMDHFENIYEAIISKNFASRKKIPGLSSERADIIIAGAAVIQCLLQLVQGRELIISGCGLREGLFFEYYGRRYGQGKALIDNILEFSTNNFLGKLENVDMGHIDQVTRIAVSMFDQLQIRHGYGQRERLMLITAARLHDVGKIINYYDHARLSAFTIGYAPLYGLQQVEQICTSFIAGYHHGTSNKTLRSYRYASLPTPENWKMIRQVSTLLALAEAADVTYEHFITSVDITLVENVAAFVMTTLPGSNYSAADYEMKKLAKQFKKEFGATLMLIWK